MLRQIVIEAATPGDSRTKFRLRIDANVVAEDLTAVQAHLLVGEILERIAVAEVGKTLAGRLASLFARWSRRRQYG